MGGTAAAAGRTGRTGGAAALSFGLLLLAAPAWAQHTREPPPELSKVLESIEKNGTFAFAAAAADLEGAAAKLDGTRARLFPKLTFRASYGAVDSQSPTDTRNWDSFGGIEMVQPLYDFGRTYRRIDAAKAEAVAAEETLRQAKNTVLLEGLALFFDLHASELEVSTLNQDHAHNYTRWERAKERHRLGGVDPVEVAEWLSKAEQSRLVYRREQTRNRSIRLRLTELSGLGLQGEMYNPPPPPKKPPPEIETQKLIAYAEAKNPELLALVKEAEAKGFLREGANSLPRLEAFGTREYSNREIRGRSEYTAGARVVWPLFDGGIVSAERQRLAAEESRVKARLEVAKKSLRRRVEAQLLHIRDAWQQVVAAKARHDYTNKRLLQRQRLYQQERVADLGRAMIEFTESEADLVRATGAMAVEKAKLAVMLGESPRRGLDEAFPTNLPGIEAVKQGPDFVPRGGTGFGQEDQNQVTKPRRGGGKEKQ